MTAPKLILSQFLPYRLAILSERVSKRLAVIYEQEFGLTKPEWRVLVHLARCQPLSVREIHSCVNLDKPAVSRAVARLESAGYVRKSANTADHRLLEISLTSAGTDVLQGIAPQALDFEAHLMNALSDSEQDQLIALMERLHDVLDADPIAPGRSSMDLQDS